MKRYVVGLTGGIGSGKSEVARLFAARGATVVDADALAHELTGPDGAAMDAIRAAFGPGVLGPDGALDRATMRRLAFSDPAARGRLEAILHPMIRARSDALIERATGPYVVLVVPLLVESGPTAAATSACWLSIRRKQSRWRASYRAAPWRQGRCVRSWPRRPRAPSACRRRTTS